MRHKVHARVLRHWFLFTAAIAFPAAADDAHWIGTWATSAQPARPGSERSFHAQTVRLIVHTSAPGKKVRVRLSNLYGDATLRVGRAFIALRTQGADIDPASNRPLTFAGKTSCTVASRSIIVTDPVELDVPALGDLAISLYFPETALASTNHSLAKQTNYVSPEGVDATADSNFPVASTMATWPFLTGVDVAASARGASIVAFGSSLTDGDGSTADANRRWPDVLAERIQKDPRLGHELGVLNEGIIGNRLLNDSPRAEGNPFGPVLGESGMARFERDVLDQPGVRYVFIGLGVNDILFPGFPFTPANETVTADQIIAGYKRLVARAHKKHVRVIGTTIPPFEGATFKAAGLDLAFYTDEREKARAAVNQWIRRADAFDDIVDFDAAVRDPDRPTRLRPEWAAPDHLHVKDGGNVAQGNAIPLSFFRP